MRKPSYCQAVQVENLFQLCHFEDTEFGKRWSNPYLTLEEDLGLCFRALIFENTASGPRNPAAALRACASTGGKVQWRKAEEQNISFDKSRPLWKEQQRVLITQQVIYNRQSQCDRGNISWGSRSTPVPQHCTIVIGNTRVRWQRWVPSAGSARGPPWTLSAGSALCPLSWVCSGPRWTGGGMEGKELGWPGPLLADGGKHHLGFPLRMLSSAAIV